MKATVDRTRRHGRAPVYRYGETIVLQPGDRVFVAPTGPATWSRALAQLLPSPQKPANLLVTAAQVQNP